MTLFLSGSNNPVDNYIAHKSDLGVQFTPPNNTVQLTTLGNALQFPVSNAIDNTLQSSVIASHANTTVHLAEQDDRPILGDNSEGSNE